jgi:hypothetical protein
VGGEGLTHECVCVGGGVVVFGGRRQGWVGSGFVTAGECMIGRGLCKGVRFWLKKGRKGSELVSAGRG